MTAFLIGISLLAAVTYGAVYARRDDKGWLGTVVKTTAVGALALLALHLRSPWPVTAGLALGAMGDLALARPGERWFLAGMGAFAAGHLAYVFQLASMAQISGAVLWLSWGLVGALVLWALIWLAPKAGPLRLPVSGYGLIIGAMLGYVLILGPGMALLKAGAILFVLSDLMLSLRLFVVQDARTRRALDLCLWPAYCGGQAMILWGFVRAFGL